MLINISAETGRRYFLSNDDIQKTLPKGAVINNIRLVKLSEKDEKYEKLCLFIDFEYNFTEDINPLRTLTIVLKNKEGFLGNTVTHSSRMTDYETCTHPQVECNVPAGSVITNVQLKHQYVIENQEDFGHLENLFIVCSHGNAEYVIVVVLTSPENYTGTLCKSFKIYPNE